jgi:hypothetical protein
MNRREVLIGGPCALARSSTMRMLRKNLPTAMAALGILASLPTVAQDSEDKPRELQELETVVITGEPIPLLWKVSKGDHVLWVAGNAALSDGRKWRSDQLEAHVAESQAVIYPGRVDVGPGIGFMFKAITLLPAALKAAKNPDGRTLKDVLPAETYARWRILKTTYMGRDNGVEKWRPSIAISMLESAVMKKIAPPPNPASMAAPPGPSVRSVVDKAAKKHKVKVRTMRNVERTLKMKNAREILKSAHHRDLGDVLCFTQSLDYLESYIEYVKSGADSPAGGDRPAQNGAARPQRVSCDDAVLKGLRSGEIPDPAGALKVIDELELQLKLGVEQRDAEWIAAAQAAIAKNRSTIAVVSMYQATSPTGYVARLRELGYTVEDPSSLGE